MFFLFPRLEHPAGWICARYKSLLFIYYYLFIFIHSNGQSFSLARRKLIIGSYFTNYSKTITHQAEIFQGKLSTIIIFIPCKLCVNL